MEGARTCRHGLGLCLSGGGFRASFYHIGVLARMAELGILKHVEVLSTVSGGSIVGAAYYLLLKKLLEEKPDQSDKPGEALQDSDYITLVQELEAHFLQAVQKNLRMRTFAHPLKNMRMSLPNYSRSDAIGEIYEKHIYRPLIRIDDRHIMMSDLYVNPKGVPKGAFHPCDETIGNVSRIHKVPILVLNATSLNTGHNWCFTASWMGEVPPRNANIRDIDKKDRYRRVRYREITTRKKDFMLGKAVAASAGVPGLFPPMAVSGLYLNRRVQLVDGGVFDNQGIVGALDPDHPCQDFIVSDASGESDAIDNPDTRLFNVLGNASSILAGRVREEMVNCVLECHKGKVAYFHLTRGLRALNIDFNEKPVDPSAASSGQVPSCLQEFHVHPEMQRALAHIRTDLDSFTDVEAGCLKADGYQMSLSRLRQLPANYLAQKPSQGNWGFQPYIDKLSANDPVTRKHLTVGSRLFLKPLFHLLKGTLSVRQTLALCVVSLPLLAMLGLMVYLINWGVQRALSVSLWQIVSDPQVFQQLLFKAAPYLYGVLIAYVISALADKLIKGGGKWVVTIRNLIKSPMSLISGTVIRVLLPCVGAIPILLYIFTIDRYFVRSIGKPKQRAKPKLSDSAAN